MPENVLLGSSAPDRGFFSIQGDLPFDFTGNDVSSAGDVNGDGIDDVIVGARQGDKGGSLSGQAYVIFGRTGPVGSIDLSNLAPDQGFVIQGAAAGDTAGTSVSAAGDVNGDGIGDIIIGADANDAGGDNAGTAYVVFGHVGAFSDIDLADPFDGFAVHGSAAGERAGISVSSAGDVNGDGFDDFMVGTISPDRAYVVFGHGGAFSDIDLATLGSAGFSIEGGAGAALWRSQSAGDVNGDGFSDLIIGALGSEKTYVVFGHAGGFTDIDLTDLGTAGFAIEHESTISWSGDSKDSFGLSVSSAGDINGDGFDDVVIGAPGFERSRTDNGSGAVYVVFGHGGAFSDVDTANLGTGGFTIFGFDREDGAGVSVSSAGDVNGDGYDDLLIGADQSGDHRAGGAYVVFGHAGGFSDIYLSSDMGSAGFYIKGATVDDLAGHAVSAAGDVNGDGYDDLIVGATTADGGGTSSGEAYVIYGRPSAAATLTGTDASEILYGSDFDDTISGFPGEDSLFGMAGNDLLNGGAGNDQLFGGAGNDTLNGREDNDTLSGGDGNDTMTGGAGDDVLKGENGNDTLSGNDGNDLLSGSTGNDLLDGGAGLDDMRGGLGDDIYYVDAAKDRVDERAGEGTDEVRTTRAAYVLGANLENLTGLLATAQQLTGNAFDNVIGGGVGNDTLSGGDGNDTLRGNDGIDQLLGGAGLDMLDGGAGADTMTGGTGDDTYIVDNAGDVVVELGGTDDGIDTILSSIDLVLADYVERLTLTGTAITATGNTLSNIIHGNGSDNTIAGGAGFDTLFGEAGADTLAGNAGEDKLYGGAGKDTMTGGQGLDQFIFEAGDTAATRADADTINDFSQAQTDRIKLKAIDANTAFTGDQKFHFIGAGAFTHTAGELHYVQDAGYTFVEGDTNGDAVADFVIRLVGTINLTGADFVL